MIYNIYQSLYKKYGAQGWWPFINYDNGNDGYHILDYNFPRNQDEVFEVCLGSILTQNTTFKSVVKSLQNLNNINCLNVKSIESIDLETLKEAIRPSGYFNQKSRYILEFIKFYNSLDGKIPTRDELLKVIGIGDETADSILLYGYNQPQFVVDAYTKRILIELNIINQKAKYKDIKILFENSLKKVIKDEKELVIVYQEYHALIVNHAKSFYSKKPYGVGCFLKEI
ncbi:MAG: endonuclease III domain-containing protein [Campylobacterota bacterium]|nr:endonuclease III domain-containing protein [Campylobacterota bacterium]